MSQEGGKSIVKMVLFPCASTLVTTHFSSLLSNSILRVELPPAQPILEEKESFFSFHVIENKNGG